ncbi:hypothetical protein FGO68_gene9759 [Halteria grandinella]|uniref:Uncharacterized protein n=1 Tax=Halteria grandinella TaxID=5974 RepID=A0A8J8SWE3_HALGN|nr:hypothetical protein FGO68_gene9759 [Halteria grandinella]
MNRTHNERSQKERKIRDLLDSVEKGKAKKKFLNNMRIQRLQMAREVSPGVLATPSTAIAESQGYIKQQLRARRMLVNDLK